MDIREINVLVLAYLGDGVYENYVRHFLVNGGITTVDRLQTESIKFVSAKAQAVFLKDLMEMGYFTDDEVSVIKRARNFRGSRHPKNCDIVTYKHATALEAVIGYLDLIGNNDRIKCIMELILGGKIC